MQNTQTEVLAFSFEGDQILSQRESQSPMWFSQKQARWGVQATVTEVPLSSSHRTHFSSSRAVPQARSPLTKRNPRTEI